MSKYEATRVDPEVVEHLPVRGRTTPPALPKAVKGEHYFGASPPLGWVSTACRLDGACPKMVFALWHEGALTKSRRVKVRKKWFALFGVKRNAAYRALDKMVAAGLIRIVDKSPGRQTLVEILPVPPVSIAHPD